ncbi:hypothetical protein GW17_00056388 [Ensete ventricosum]|nr:hypothetical protein GW17_00056388 [Ensete ventricosum]
MSLIGRLHHRIFSIDAGLRVLARIENQGSFEPKATTAASMFVPANLHRPRIRPVCVMTVEMRPIIHCAGTNVTGLLFFPSPHPLSSPCFGLIRFDLWTTTLPRLKQMRKDIAKLLENGQEATARIREAHRAPHREDHGSYDEIRMVSNRRSKDLRYRCLVTITIKTPAPLRSEGIAKSTTKLT